MLGAIIKITGACAAAFGINYTIWFKAIPPVAEVAASKMFSDATPYLDIIVPKIQEFLKDNRAHHQVMSELQGCVYHSTQLILKVLWFVGQVWVSYDNRDAATELLGLSSGESHALQPSNKESQEEV